MFVEPVIFIQYRNTRCFNRRNTAEQIPQTFKMIFHFTSSTHYITAGRIVDSITCTAGNIHCFQNMDVRTRHLCITYKEACGSKRGKSASYNISMFVIYTFRFFRMSKCFIVSIRIVDSLAVSLIFSTLRIAIIVLNGNVISFLFTEQR